MGEMILYPMRMEGVFKETLWGGDRLRRYYGKDASFDHLGESWELSAVPGSESPVANGVYQGMDLNSLRDTFGSAFWGEHCRAERFPLLVKLIDAAQDLSVQVHPSDALAISGEQGKAEMWYVLEARPGACLYLGFSRRVDRETILQSCEDGSVLSLMNRVSVSRGDVFYIQPGTVHAIGKGLTVAEIQQNSDTTFRIYDYHRLDSAGQPRELHWERAAEIMDCEPLIPERCRANSMAQFDGFTLSELFSCGYFRSYRLELRESVKLNCDASSFHSLLCVDGSGSIFHAGEAYPISKGQSYYLPAGMGGYELSGKCTVLLSWI